MRNPPGTKSRQSSINRDIIEKALNLPQPSAEFNVSSCSNVFKFALTSVFMELTELIEKLTMDFDTKEMFAEPNCHFYSFIRSTTSESFERYMQTKSALCWCFVSGHRSKPICNLSFAYSKDCFEILFKSLPLVLRKRQKTERETSAQSKAAKKVLAGLKLSTCVTNNTSTEEPLLCDQKRPQNSRC